MAAARRILAYLAGTADLELTYEAQKPEQANLLWGFADSDHAGDPDTRRSVTGYVTMMNGAAVSWGSHRQQIVALSSSEAEFYAASAAGCDVAHFRMLLDQLGLAQAGPTVVFEDNWACIHLSRNSVLHHKSKHIDVRVYHLRDLCRQGVMNLLKIGTADQAADALTKALPSPAFIQHRSVMMNIAARNAGDRGRRPVRE